MRRPKEIQKPTRATTRVSALKPEAQGDYSTLIKHLNKVKNPDLRAQTLAKVLLVADEMHPQFATLMNALREGERPLVLGTLLAATRLEPFPERRILRLKRLLEVSPETVKGVYWLEAETLVTTGSDDAKLTLLGLARNLPPTLQPMTLRSLKIAVQGVEEVFKRAMAFVALAELTWLSNDELREAEACAERIPDTLLRVMTLERLEKINLERLESDRPRQ